MHTHTYLNHKGNYILIQCFCKMSFTHISWNMLIAIFDLFAFEEQDGFVETFRKTLVLSVFI